MFLFCWDYIFLPIVSFTCIFQVIKLHFGPCTFWLIASEEHKLWEVGLQIASSLRHWHLDHRHLSITKYNKLNLSQDSRDWKNREKMPKYEAVWKSIRSILTNMWDHVCQKWNIQKPKKDYSMLNLYPYVTSIHWSKFFRNQLGNVTPWPFLAWWSISTSVVVPFSRQMWVKDKRPEIRRH